MSAGDKQEERVYNGYNFSYASPEDGWFKRLIINTVESSTGKPQLQRIYNELHDNHPDPYKIWKETLDKLNVAMDFDEAQLEKIPKIGPVIFVANHQGMYDIIGMIWFLRKFHPKFVSKVELGKGIPSVSYNLRHGGSVLIDRKNPKQAIPEIKKMGEYIEKNNRSAVIFPEGTRSKNGEPKPFAESGLKILCKYAPSAYIVPVTINNSWKVLRYGKFPLGLGNQLEFIFHEPMAVKGSDFEELFKKTEQTVINALNN